MTWILIDDLVRGVRQLDPVTIHHKDNRCTVQVSAHKTVQSLTGHPTGVAAMAEDQTFVPVMGSQSERKTDCDRNHHAKPPAAQFCPAREPRDMAGNVKPTTKLIDHKLGIQVSPCSKR